MPRPIQATIHTQAFVANLAVARRFAPDARVWAVVKANAYGHGIERVFEGLRGADGFAEFCQLNYGVSFPMMAKIDVNGSDAHPLYHYLSQEAPGLLGSKAIKWNFTKFLIGKDGSVLKRYAPTDTPMSLSNDIEAALAA
jgi:hypothetical protein